MNVLIKWRESVLKWLDGESHKIVEPPYDYGNERIGVCGCVVAAKDVNDTLKGHHFYLDRHQMQLDVIDWLMLPPTERLSTYTQGVVDRPEDLQRICQWRGITPATFHWLAQNSYFGIGTHFWFVQDQIEWGEKPSLGVWSQPTAIFPVYNDQGELTSFHHRILPNGTWEPKVPWCCEPAGEKLSPMIIGDVATADLVVIAESTWDVVAYIDLRGLCQETGWAAIATRGAGNAQRLPTALIKEGAVVFAAGAE